MNNVTMSGESVIDTTEMQRRAPAVPQETSAYVVLGTNRAPAQYPLAGFFPDDGGTEEAGISLVHMAAQDSAKVGDLLTFTAWILNATNLVLTDVSLHLCSFTNELGEQLNYRTEPQTVEFVRRTLGPRQALKYCFSYVVTERDLEEPGLLISALRADLVMPGRGRVFSECDALISVAVPSVLSLP
ncbi:hypothetical protein SAMN04489740_4346 [Arthrobacter alpinus]|uniref:Uncharacterized protein n=1 Tax=Arthrobacter alpinus TaxID=656366 RepID=A0A1H5PJ32_9MICC|nr:hypothetical protein [Arthrobacter alpinus]SEF13218.1 hypothetical protein SAMN04489740_4346 [Arthrobacter alpinus]